MLKIHHRFFLVKFSLVPMNRINEDCSLIFILKLAICLKGFLSLSWRQFTIARTALVWAGISQSCVTYGCVLGGGHDRSVIKCPSLFLDMTKLYEP